MYNQICLMNFADLQHSQSRERSISLLTRCLATSEGEVEFAPPRMSFPVGAADFGSLARCGAGRGGKQQPPSLPLPPLPPSFPSLPYPSLPPPPPSKNPARTKLYITRRASSSYRLEPVELEEEEGLGWAHYNPGGAGGNHN